MQDFLLQEKKQWSNVKIFLRKSFTPILNVNQHKSSKVLNQVVQILHIFTRFYLFFCLTILSVTEK
jgi:hypothetical protein